MARGSFNFQVAGASRSEGIDQYEIVVLNGTAMAIPATDLTDCAGSGCFGGDMTLVFTDLTADSKLNSGDFFRLSGGDSTSDYTVMLIWKQTGDKVGEQEIKQ